MKFPEDYPINIMRMPDVIKKVRLVSDYIRILPLIYLQNEALVSLMKEQLCEAERNAFAQGLKMGLEFKEWDKSS